MEKESVSKHWNKLAADKDLTSFSFRKQTGNRRGNLKQ